MTLNKIQSNLENEHWNIDILKWLNKIDKIYERSMTPQNTLDNTCSLSQCVAVESDVHNHLSSKTSKFYS